MQGHGLSLRVRVRLWPFYLVLHNLFHSLLITLSLANPVFNSILLLYHITLTTHVQPVHACLFQYKGIRLYTDVSIRNKVEKYSDPYTPQNGLVCYSAECDSMIRRLEDKLEVLELGLTVMR